jgi:anti-sigma factor RsiW
MSTRTHLSDEAVAAFADGVLSGHARERASRHVLACPECAHAVAVQREAVWALRAAQAPSLPTSLVDRLRSVPTTTPLGTMPAAMGPDGSAMFAAFGSMGSAALVPQRPSAGQRDREAHADPHAARRPRFGLGRLFGR